MHAGQTTAQARDKQIRNAAAAMAAMLLSQLVLVFGDLISLDYICELWNAGRILLSGTALGCAFWLNGISWRLHSSAGDRILRNYWIYCTVLAALSALDDCGNSIWAMLALVSTPLGPWMIVAALLPKIAGYRVVCGLALAFSLAQVFYYHGMLRCHRSGGKKA